jgi:GR25 family glycosyltransferase involved in LPS biosynthesis
MKTFIIHNKKLTNRKKYLDITINKLKELNFDIEIIDFDFNIDNDKLKKSTNLIKTNIDDFDRNICYINKYMVSNIEKHRYIYKKMIDNNINYALILEDDSIISNDYINNIKDFKNNINKFINNWDIILTGFTSNNDTNSNMSVFNLDSTILPSKASYVINKNIAEQLYKYSLTYSYSMRIIMSKFIYDNKLKIGIINKYLFLEGSKIGIFSSSFNRNNVLIFNPDFIKIAKLVNDNKIDINTINNYYNNIKHFNSPDISHIMGIIYYKNNNYSKAKDFFEEAYNFLKNDNGYLGYDSEILNNCINIYQFNQN